ncbi:hypothetical protein CcaverHIS002_0700510 [Cutaneotrichosporon cavernicola]|uniref:Tubby C-terminal-like domain-containing protein n=1 Tax=Cutaneotrichosporon cavernicola TaxID=279322 RepID=A0AA48L9N5_9TREE|nr:uncharacterized protein CcaverHIS019_0700520 [Cutaneotrichosporon cavernicola]BEI86705.1 hypothetical protein CcaverHIS002_0700510 [Cutaneotrichosporon cavernicola]BEI94480.1 hypothetical protein CcaverHIS019_0700520 [Cutaneotrichosporon cavernicola]BEJ02256.1 hypothetical protein CcaverHIS631_0700510 [Cutaneotrichosporon cavernicola]BEJ10015.1 hypothetical protein CcaverHIS641_0700500 [Cutaneotrichosporon cavernicola]
MSKDKHKDKDAQRMLDPLDTPISLIPGYIRDNQTTLVFHDKVIAAKEETFDVDEGETRVFRATGKPLKLKNIKRIADVNGATLFKITASYQGTLQRAFTGSNEVGEMLFRAEKKWSWGAKLQVTFADSKTGDPVTLIVKGYGLMRTAEVTLDGQVIALFTREFWSKDLLSNSKTYHLTVAAGVDLALMTALCIIFDECKFDDAKHG